MLGMEGGRAGAGAGNPAGAAESSGWRGGRDERWNLCLSWQRGTVTMAQIAWAPRELQQHCGRVDLRNRDWGDAEPGAHVPVPVPVPIPDPDSQSVSVPSGTSRWLAPWWMRV